jgi:U3 small nucleolar RNA-associated protein 12
MLNPLLLGMKSPLYILWVLKSVRHSELEQSLLVLPLGHVERLLYYLVILLKSGRGVKYLPRQDSSKSGTLIVVLSSMNGLKQ